ncbi:hypothetical protein AAY473_024913 [Plecturocebus cupreus]
MVSFAFLHHQGGWPSSSAAPALTPPPPYMPTLCPQLPGLPEGLQQLPWLTVTLCFLDFSLDLSGMSTTDRSSESSQFRSTPLGLPKKGGWTGSSACAVNPPFPHTPAPCPQHPRLPEGFFSSSHVLTVTLYFLDRLCFIQEQLLGEMSSEQVLRVFNRDSVIRASGTYSGITPLLRKYLSVEKEHTLVEDFVYQSSDEEEPLQRKVESEVSENGEAAVVST